MKKLLCLVFAAVMLFASVGMAKEDASVYTELYSTELNTIDYVDGTLTALSTFAYTCELGLTYFDNFGLMRPGLAENWSVSEDGCVYTFHIRPDTWWVDCEGEKIAPVTANDFVTACKHILDPDPEHGGDDSANTVYDAIVGAKEYYDAKVAGEDPDYSTVGIQALDDMTVQYTLRGPLPYFLGMLGNNVWYPVPTEFYEEHYETYGTSAEDLLYCGCYYCESFDFEYQRVFKRNAECFLNDKVTVDTLIYRYNKEATSNGAELFLRGDMDRVTLNMDLVKEWMSDETKKNYYCPEGLNNMSYWIAFNFDPQVEPEFEPENWLKAVNNVNFRKSLFYGFNAYPYCQVINEWDYKDNNITTYTRPDLVNVGTLDYTELSGLDEYSHQDLLFDEAKALEYKATAIEELTALGVTFPIKMKCTYNTSATTEKRYQVLKSQLESTLGSDYIQIILEPYSGSSFNADVRNAGNWQFMELGWGPDYADPMSQFDPILLCSIGKNWGKIYLATEYYDETLGYGEVEKKAREANAILTDNDLRYKTFAEAEKMLLDSALVIPAYRGGGSYQATYIIPFTGATGQFGDGGARYSYAKFAQISDHPISYDEYQQLHEQYLIDREAARVAYETEKLAYVVAE